MFNPEHSDWVRSEVGGAPFDVAGVSYLLHGMEAIKNDSGYKLESTRRTLEAMVRDGLLEKITSYEQRLLYHLYHFATNPLLTRPASGKGA